jgi:hypothetical protein
MSQTKGLHTLDNKKKKCTWPVEEPLLLGGMTGGAEAAGERTVSQTAETSSYDSSYEGFDADRAKY